MTEGSSSAPRFSTHEVFNQPVELTGANLYDSDAALKEAVKREGAGWAENALGAFGARAGSAETAREEAWAAVPVPGSRADLRQAFHRPNFRSEPVHFAVD